MAAADLPGGDIFQVEESGGVKSFFHPESEEVGERKELVPMLPTLPDFVTRSSSTAD